MQVYVAMPVWTVLDAKCRRCRSSITCQILHAMTPVAQANLDHIKAWSANCLVHSTLQSTETVEMVYHMTGNIECDSHCHLLPSWSERSLYQICVRTCLHTLLQLTLLHLTQAHSSRISTQVCWRWYQYIAAAQTCP